MNRAWGAVAVAVGVWAFAGQAAVVPRPSLAEPALSPDGSEIAFVSGGDIWTVPSQGGVARLLVSDPATESRPRYSPDGTRLAFQSTRDGPPSIYILTLATGRIARLTYADAAEVLDAPRDFDGLRIWLHGHPYEGIVWHHPDGRMVKIKGKDFGLKR